MGRTGTCPDEPSRNHPLNLPSPPVHLGNRVERVGGGEPQRRESVTPATST
jgi:hypothetical protein